MQAELVPIESGRVVVTFVRRTPRVPMVEAIFVSPLAEPVRYGAQAAAILYEPMDGKPGTLAAVQFFVGDEAFVRGMQSSVSLCVARVFAHAPRIAVCDHSFLYQKFDPSGCEGSRALKACEGVKRYGTFRADSSDVGLCFRTGHRRCTFEVSKVDAGYAGRLVQTHEDEDEDEA